MIHIISLNVNSKYFNSKIIFEHNIKIKDKCFPRAVN